MALTHTLADSVVLLALQSWAKRLSWFDTPALLRLQDSGVADQYVVVKTCTDAASRLFKWDGTSTGTDDGISYIKPAGVTGAGRWVDADADQQSTSLPSGVVYEDGSVPFIARQQGIDPSDPADLATKRYVDGAIAAASFITTMIGIRFVDAGAPDAFDIGS